MEEVQKEEQDKRKNEKLNKFDSIISTSVKSPRHKKCPFLTISDRGKE
jgi:hypothetical protein